MTDRLAGVMSGILANSGSGAAGSGRIKNKVRRITTGSTMLDVRLGGGLRVGEPTLFWGEKSSGKTTTAMRVIGLAQGLCRRCLRPAKDVEAVKPDSGNKDARWSSKGFCDCVKENITPIERCTPARMVLEPAVPADPARGTKAKKEKIEPAKDYQARVDANDELMQENSYEEFICVLVDPENAFDAEWATILGVDTRRLFLDRPSTAEEAIDHLNAITTSTFADLILVDSFAHFVPREEREASSENWQQGLAARLLNKGIRGWIGGAIDTQRAGSYGITQIWINQVRYKIGVTYGDPSTKFGGEGQNFAARTEVRFFTPKLNAKDGDSEEVSIGRQKYAIPLREHISFAIVKGGHTKKMKGIYTMALRDGDPKQGEHHKMGDVLELDDLWKTAMHLGMVEKNSAGYFFAGEQCRTQAIAKELLEERADLREAVRHVIFQKFVFGLGR